MNAEPYDEVEVEACCKRWLARRAAEPKLEKLSRLADPARNNNPHERAVALAKFVELNARLNVRSQSSMPRDNRGPIQYCWEESDLYTKICLIISPIVLSIWIFGFMNPHPTPEKPLTAEEKIKAERLDKIDAAMEALQNERDQIEPPQDETDDTREEHNYW
jgi:hypothetical protein